MRLTARFIAEHGLPVDTIEQHGAFYGRDAPLRPERAEEWMRCERSSPILGAPEAILSAVSPPARPLGTFLIIAKRTADSTALQVYFWGRTSSATIGGEIVKHCATTGAFEAALYAYLMRPPV